MSRWIITFEVEVDAETEDDAVEKAKLLVGSDQIEPSEIEDLSEDDDE